MGCCCSSTLVDDHDSDTSKSGDTKQTPLVRNDTNENDRYVPNTSIMVPIATTNISEIAHCVLMLVDGYIRCIGKALNDQSTEYIINNIIPKSINQICFTYYYVCNVYMLYHLRELIASDRYGLTMYDIDEVNHTRTIGDTDHKSNHCDYKRSSNVYRWCDTDWTCDDE
eukprot:36423_1